VRVTLRGRAARLLPYRYAVANLKAISHWVLRSGKRIAITVIGFGLVIAGLVLIIFPGPFTIPLLIAGLAVLATEYAWARRALDETKKRTRSAVDRFRKRAKS
jgi:hypothetical protein